MARRKKKRSRGKKRPHTQYPSIGPPTSAWIQVEQFKSGIGAKPEHREALTSLGLRHPNDVVERQDTEALRGLLRKIPHLVRIVRKKEDKKGKDAEKS